MHIFYLVNSKLEISNSNINTSKIKDDRKSLDNNNNSDSKVIDHFPHQVGGHSAMLSIEGNICKPLINRELQFYQFSQQKDNIHSFFISPFLAKFYGVIEVLKSKNEISDTLETTTTTTTNNVNHNNNINIDYNHNSIINNKNNKKVKDCKHPSGTQQRYIVLEDLTKSYKKPCIVDIKVGTRQRGAICSTTTSTTLGIRVCGMKIFNQEIGNIVFDRYYGRTLNTETLEDSLFNFFTSNIYNKQQHHQSQQQNIINFNIERIKLLDSIIEKLSQIECIISNKNEKFPFKIYSSSLLIIYEGGEDSLTTSTTNTTTKIQSSITDTTTTVDENNNINNTNCIDINMSQFNEPLSNSSSCITTPSQSPTTSLLNISNQSNDSIIGSSSNSKIQDNINKILKSSTGNTSINSFRNSTELYKSPTTPMDESSDDTFGTIDDDIDESFISSDLDSDIDETLSNSSHSNNSNGIQSTSNNSSIRSNKGCLRNDVKMIDFAHAIPHHEQDAAEEDGYLFGIQNLQLLLFKVKSRILYNNNISKNDNSNTIININQNRNSLLDSSSLSSSSSSTSFSPLSQTSSIDITNDFGSVANSASSSNSDFSFLKLYQKELNNSINNTNNSNTFIQSFY